VDVLPSNVYLPSLTSLEVSSSETKWTSIADLTNLRHLRFTAYKEIMPPEIPRSFTKLRSLEIGCALAKDLATMTALSEKLADKGTNRPNLLHMCCDVHFKDSYLRKFPKIRSLECSSVAIGISRLTNLTSLSLLVVDNLGWLSALTKLRTLNLPEEPKFKLKEWMVWKLVPKLTEFSFI
jgi:hypothetical protein